MAITFGLDISHHQDRALDLAAARRDGCEFVFLKAGEGGAMVDDEFAPNLAEARAAGQIPAAYWFVRSNASPAAHVALLQRVVPKDVAVIPDVETAADGTKPSLAHARAVLDAIRTAGYRVPLSYIPLWYWRDIWGSPSLADWPPLWSSRYPDNVVGTLADEWADVPARYWDGFGGLPVAVLQFTSSARVAGYQPLDANAYRGTRAELAALLGGTTAPRKSTEDSIVKLEAKFDATGAPVKTYAEIPVAGGRALRLAVSYGNSVQIHGITGVYDTPAGKGGRTAPVATGFKLDADRPGPINTLPQDGLSHLVVEYTSAVDFTGWVA